VNPLTPILPVFERTLNQYLKLDPDALTRLAALSGRLLKIDVQGLNIDVWLLFHEQRIELIDDYTDVEADACIRGAPMALLSLARGRSILESDVTVTGDVALAQRFSRLLLSLDIDWDEHLSVFTGDTVAHTVGQFVRSLRSTLQRSSDSMQSNTADYLRDETNHLPHDWEVEEHLDAVDAIRDRVDTLALRIAALTRDGCSSR